MTQETHQSNVEKQTPQFKLETWKPSDVPSIARLETATWAPWLRKPPEQIEHIAKRLPDIQLLAKNPSGIVVATLTTNRINWDGNPTSLTTWDDIAGGSVQSSDYSDTYNPDGNTICLMSMNVDPTFRGAKLAPQLTEQMKTFAQELQIDHLISSFRPSGYGEYKLQHGKTDFAEYCNMTNENGEPIDPWLRSVHRLGMKPLRIEMEAMKINVTRDTFEEYRGTYHKEKWKQMEDGTWECGETGSWKVEDNHAVYTEPNLWGEIPLLSSADSSTKK